MTNFIGPALPPHLQKKLEISDENLSKDTNNENSSQIGPSLPSEKSNKEKKCSQGSKIGLSLPACKLSDSSTSSDANLIGPALPPHLKQKCNPEEHDDVLILHAEVSDEETFNDEMYGPVLPPGLKVSSSKSRDEDKKNVIGPSLPKGIKLIEYDSSDSDSDVVGPMPTSGGSNSTYIEDQLNERALRMKRKLKGEDDESGKQIKRESWMLELPPDRAAEFGLGPRQFRVREKLEVGDRSVWTDTPADRLKKKHSQVETSDVAREMDIKSIHERDKEMERLIEQHSSKKKKDSLLEMHQKELKKKKKKEKEEGKVQERRPFDRNVDLQANRFDEAQKKAIFKKAQLLNDRFSSGQSKFL